MQSLLPTPCPTLKFDDKCDEIIGTKLAHVGEQCFTSRKHKGNNNNDNDDDQDEKEDDGYIVNHENPFDDDDDDDDEYADAQQHMAYVQLSAQNGRCKKRLPPPSSTTSKIRRQGTTETHTLKDNDDDEHENDDDKKDVSSSSSSSARSRKNARHESDKITKLFICAPAHIMLSRDEHTSLRMYAESIKVHFDDDGKKGNGGRVGGFAAAYMRSSKRSDHKAPVYYDTRYDLVTEYANPKWKNGLKEHDGRSRQNNITQEEIANTVNARQMHMVFRRERQYTKGGVVNVESTGVSLRPRGICATLIQILESRIMGHVMVPEFRLLVFSGIMDAFQRWLISTTTSSSRRQKILLDVNNDLSHEEACSVIGAKQNTTSQDDDGGVVDDSHCTLGHPAESTLLPPAPPPSPTDSSTSSLPSMESLITVRGRCETEEELLSFMPGPPPSPTDSFTSIECLLSLPSLAPTTPPPEDCDDDGLSDDDDLISVTEIIKATRVLLLCHECGKYYEGDYDDDDDCRRHGNCRCHM